MLTTNPTVTIDDRYNGIEVLCHVIEILLIIVGSLSRYCLALTGDDLQ